ncbi:transporter substrate-binding domain-containing protein [Zooshikella sp. RANM57]|uniref:transporter substrate-binding domain-containing protein n=1 Tax=Zooshikella sp. RANM57 TaxID=3425863 RepID=UPI003D6E00AC
MPLFSPLVAFAAEPISLHHVKLKINGPHQFAYAGYYAAIDNGYFRAFGLTVTIETGDSDHDVINLVSNQQAEFGVAGAKLIQARLANKPVLLLANLFKQTPKVIVLKGIDKSPQALKEQRLAVENPYNLDLVTRVFLYQQGIPLDQVKLVVEQNPLQAWQQGKIAGFTSRLDQLAEVEALKIPHTVLRMSDWGIHFYEGNLFTSEAYVSKHPQLVKDFIAASLRGWQYALKHPKETAQLIHQRYSPQVSVEKLMQQADALKEIILEKGELEIGSADWGELRKMGRALLAMGVFGSDMQLNEMLFESLQGKQVRLASLEWPPFVGNTLPENGMTSAIVVDAFAKVGYQVKVDFLPWTEAVRRTSNEEYDGYFPEYYDPELAKRFIYSKPVGQSYVALAQRKAYPIHWRIIDDLEKYRIGVVEGYLNHPLLDRKISLGEVETYNSVDDARNLQALSKGLVDASVVDPAVYYYLMQTHPELRGNEESLKLNQRWLGTQQLHIAFANNSRGKQLNDIFSQSFSSVTSAKEQLAYITQYQHQYPILTQALLTLEASAKQRQLEEANLSPEHRGWIRKNPVLRVPLVDNQPPFIFEKQPEKFQGFIIDYISLLASKVGLRVQFFPLDSVMSLRQHFQQENYSLMISELPDLLTTSNTVLSPTVLTDPLVFVGNRAKSALTQIEDLEQKKVGVVEHTTAYHLLVKKYPLTQWEVYSDAQTLLKAVSKQDVDAAILHEATFNYITRNYWLPDIYITGQPQIVSVDKSLSWHFIVSQKDPQLFSILNEGIQQITPIELQQLQRKWIKSPRLEPSSRMKLVLTEDELQWLRQHPLIRVSNETDWPPFDYAEEGVPKGYSIDLMNLLAKHLGLRFEYITGPPWQHFLDMMRKHELDLLHTAFVSPEREQYMLFSQPYLILPMAVAAIDKNKAQQAMQSNFQQQRIAIVKGYNYERTLKEYFPGAKLVSVTDPVKGLQSVLFNDADMYMDSKPVLHYLLERYNMHQLQVVDAPSNVNIDNDELTVAVRNDWPILRNIINKALTNISDAEKQVLSSRWLQSTVSDHQQTVQLTSEEQEWLKRNPVLKVANETDWPPFDFYEDGKPQGLSVDYINLLAKKIGFTVEFITESSWNKLLNQGYEKNLDILVNIVKTPERSEHLVFTKPYAKLPNTLISRQEDHYQTLQQLTGKVLAFTEGFYIGEFLKKSFPKINIRLTNSSREALKLVSLGKADATIESSATGKYLIEREGITNLVLANNVLELDKQHEALHFAVNKKNKILLSILNKGISELSLNEVQQINAKWIGDYSHAVMEGLRLDLTFNEKKFVAQKRQIKYCINEHWQPVEFITPTSEHSGMTADYLQLITERTGLSFSLVTAKEGVRSSCDVLLAAMDLPSLREKYNFTRPLLRLPLVVAVRLEKSFIENINSLQGLRIGVISNSITKEILQKNNVGINIVEYETVEKGFNDVVSGDIDGFVDDIAAISYWLQKKRAHEIKIAGRLDLEKVLSIGVSKYYPELLSILDKTIETLTVQDQEQIYNHWMKVTMEEYVDYSLLWNVLMIVSGIIIVVVFWNRKITTLYRQLQYKSNQIESLLHNSGQGFLTFDDNLFVEPQYSIECERIFHCPPSGKKITSLLPLANDTDASLYERVLSRLKRTVNPLKVEMLLSLLPSSFVIAGRFIAAEYRYVQQKIMMILTDMTEEKELQENLEEERRNLEFVVSILTDGQDIFYLLDEFEQFISNLQQLYASSQALALSVNVRQVLQEFHTFKGIFYQYGFKRLPDAIHEVEQKIINLPDKKDYKKVLIHVVESNLMTCLEQDLNVVRRMFGDDFLANKGGVVIGNQQLDMLVKKAKQVLANEVDPEQTRALARYALNMKAVDLHTMLAAYEKTVQRLAKRCAKEVSFVLEGESVIVNPDRFTKLIHSLIHLFRNAVDHGIEAPDVRLEAGKEACGEILCTVTAKEGFCIITVVDDGAGISITSLRTQLQERYVAKVAEFAKMSDAELLPFVFEHGISTCSSANEISGRGIGLAAVKEAVEELHGTISVTSQRGKGTQFKMSIPLQYDDM